MIQSDHKSKQESVFDWVKPSSQIPAESILNEGSEHYHGTWDQHAAAIGQSR